jgi:hypothetical protein
MVGIEILSQNAPTLAMPSSGGARAFAAQQPDEKHADWTDFATDGPDAGELTC